MGSNGGVGGGFDRSTDNPGRKTKSISQSLKSVWIGAYRSSLLRVAIFLVKVIN